MSAALLPSRPPYQSLICHDREDIDRAVGELSARAGQRVFCVQREARFLRDHSIEENWMLPYWQLARDDEEEWQWLLELGRGMFARYSGASPAAYPGELDALALLAAQFGQAHIVMPDILVLDSVFSGWHRSDQEQVGRMVRDYAGRHPLRSVVHVDVVEPPSGILPFVAMEGSS